MRALLSFCANRDIFVMIDETYVEFAPSVQEVTAVPYTKEFSNLMVLRGVSNSMQLRECVLDTALPEIKNSYLR